jgi:hypothetical protein
MTVNFTSVTGTYYGRPSTGVGGVRVCRWDRGGRWVRVGWMGLLYRPEHVPHPQQQAGLHRFLGRPALCPGEMEGQHIPIHQFWQIGIASNLLLSPRVH